MNIKINGEEKNIAQGSVSVSTLLTLEKVEMPEMVSVELNGDILDRESFDTTQIKEGDALEFLYFMGGGTLL